MSIGLKSCSPMLSSQAMAIVGLSGSNSNKDTKEPLFEPKRGAGFFFCLLVFSNFISGVPLISSFNEVHLYFFCESGEDGLAKLLGEK